MYKTYGRLIYNKSSEINPEQGWAILKLDNSIMHYYQWWLRKYYAIEFQKRTIWGAHVSVVYPEENVKFPNKVHNNLIEVSYNNDISRFGAYFTIPVVAPTLEKVRESLGLSATPPVPFHITIGRLDINLQERTNKAREIYLPKIK